MYLLRKHIFTALFIPILLSFSAWNVWNTAPALLAAAQGESPRQAVAALDSAVTENLAGRMDFIEFYSWLQRLMDKREIGNFAYIKDEAGFLHYNSFFREADPRLFDYALRVKRMRDWAARRGTQLLFVLAPSKYIPGVTRLRPGLSANDPAAEAETLLIYLNRLGVRTLDLGAYLPGEGLSYEQTFFRTDHHWTIPAAFEASKILFDTLNRRFGADLDGKSLEKDQYRAVTYPKGMLGSMGRRTGVNFVGLEDFTALWPLYDNQYIRDTLEESGTVTHTEGSTERTLLMLETLEQDRGVYRDSMYSLYLNGVRAYDRILNVTNPERPTVFFLRDSYFSPVMTFLAPCFGRMEAMWLLEDQVDIEDFVKENEFDYIVVELYPYNIGDEAFNFFREE